MEKKKKNRIIIIAMSIFIALVIFIMVRVAINTFNSIAPSNNVETKFELKLPQEKKEQKKTDGEEITDVVKNIAKGKDELTSTKKNVSIGFSSNFTKQKETITEQPIQAKEELLEVKEEVKKTNKDRVNKAMGKSSASGAFTPNKKSQTTTNQPKTPTREELLQQRKLALEKGFDIVADEAKNSDLLISAVVYGEQTLESSDAMKLRTTKEITYNNTIIPKNTIIFAKITFTKNRALCSLSSIVIKNKTIHTELVGYGYDNLEGIPISTDETKKAIDEEVDKSISDEISAATMMIGGVDVSGIISGIGSTITKNKKKKRVLFHDNTSIIFKKNSKKK